MAFSWKTLLGVQLKTSILLANESTIEGKTTISNKTEIQKDSPCKELTLEGLKSLYLLQWGIWTKWEMNMVMNMKMNVVTIISFWYSIADMKQAEKHKSCKKKGGWMKDDDVDVLMTDGQNLWM